MTIVIYNYHIFTAHRPYPQILDKAEKNWNALAYFDATAVTNKKRFCEIDTRTPPRSAMPPRRRLHICKKIQNINLSLSYISEVWLGLG